MNIQQNGNIASGIQDAVADTLFIPLFMKCKESHRKDAILQDPLACEMVGKLNYDFSRYSKGIMSYTGVAIRARHFDNKVRRFINKVKQPVVVLIGCGLDSRYYRLKDIQSKAIFYELDIPEVIALREKLLPPAINDVYLPHSMFETGWMDELKEKHPDASFVFVIEGVFMYFDEQQVKSVLQNLAQRFAGCEIHFDVINKWMSRRSHIHDTVKYTNATFQFGCDNDREFEQWHPGLKHFSTALFTNVKEWKRAGIRGLLLKLIPTFKYSGRMLHYRVTR
ncbi:MAG: class I SAM-dependent methyltransferase [Chitinophagaceae bacterium]|nr:class I SAM-dependent methyltransferase [Chitinophagaceae bacterium]